MEEKTMITEYMFNRHSVPITIHSKATNTDLFFNAIVKDTTQNVYNTQDNKNEYVTERLKILYMHKDDAKYINKGNVLISIAGQELEEPLYVANIDQRIPQNGKHTYIVITCKGGIYPKGSDFIV